MGQCQQGLKQGDGQKAADAIGKMAQQLDQMQQEMNEMEMLDMAMDQIEMAKDAMACKICNGEGCQDCMGNMANNGKFNPNGKPGRGLKGQGPAWASGPRKRTATNLRDTRVRQNARRGAATFGGLVEGPNIKGEVGQSIKEEMATLSAEPADPLTSERLPNSRREHAEQYFQAAPRRQISPIHKSPYIA